MHYHYEDIRNRIAEPPLWWDEHAVPRYEPFHPNRVANIYARQVALALIACQGCGHEFQVAFSQDALEQFKVGRTLAEMVGARAVHYGDPPNIRCCPAGPTMNSEPCRILEFWRLDRHDFEWVRAPEFEVDITPDWVAPRA